MCTGDLFQDLSISLCVSPTRKLSSFVPVDCVLRTQDYKLCPSQNKHIPVVNWTASDL